jgi:hypothetical protein
MSTAGPTPDPGRDACLTWLARRLDADVRRAPPLLWHYTDAGGLLGIVGRERLWATQTSFLNDSTELAYGIDLVTRAMASYDPSNLKEQTARFLERLFDPHRALLARWLDKNLDVYVTCFCHEGDLLSQWRAYAGRDDAGGYAIGMGTDPPMQGWPQDAPGNHGVALRRVLYDPVEQEAACHELVDTLVPILDSAPTDDELQRSFARNLVNGVVEFASWCKDPAFEEEQEWRIVYVRNNDDDKLPIHHRMARGLLVPYVELELPCPVEPLQGHLPLQSIHLGPGPEPALKLRGLQTLLAGFPHFADVRLEGSAAPLRI